MTYIIITVINVIIILTVCAILLYYIREYKETVSIYKDYTKNLKEQINNLSSIIKLQNIDKDILEEQIKNYKLMIDQLGSELNIVKSSYNNLLDRYRKLERHYSFQLMYDRKDRKKNSG